MAIPIPGDERTRLLLDTTYALLFQTGQWPTFDVLDRHLDQRGDGDALGALRAAPAGLVYGLGPGNAAPSDQQVIALSLAALMACEAAWEDVAAFVTTVRYAVELADSTAPEAAGEITITSEHIRTRQRIAAGADALVSRLYHVLSVEPWGARSSHRDPDSGAWSFTIHPRRLRRLRGATTAEECWNRMHPESDEQMFDDGASLAGVAQDISRNVWVVHGRDLAARDAMFEFLRALGLNPMEFGDVATKTGSGAPYVGQILDTAFRLAQAIVVLLTPDEVAYLRSDLAESIDETTPAYQSRPNVLFEAGMAFGSHPDQTILVELGDLRPFSDIAGRHVIRLTNQPGPLNDLAARLDAAGCPVNRNGTDWMRADRFTLRTTELPLGKKIPSSSGTGPRLGIRLAFHPSGNGGRLHVRNIGTETLYDVELVLPPDVAMFRVITDGPIPKIPAGETVRLAAFAIKAMGGNGPSSFDVTVSARTEDCSEFRDEVFLDIGG